jgi:MFS transporter, putative metabolite:H+ symporter
MSLAQAASVTARLDRLSSSPYLWRLLVLLSLGGFFEVYDLFLTAYVTPGLIRDNIFLESNKGLFGLTDQATFAAAMFAGLFVGTILFGWVADKYGRRMLCVCCCGELQYDSNIRVWKLYQRAKSTYMR